MSGEPRCSTAYSTLPICVGVATLPVTRITKISPSPLSKTISGGTRESEQDRTMAKGFWPLESACRTAAVAFF